MILELGPPGPMLRFELVGGMAQEEAGGTITVLIDHMKRGDVASFEKLWARCFSTIVGLARQRLGSARKRVEDEEDVASAVFQKLYFASVNGAVSTTRTPWRIRAARHSAAGMVPRVMTAK